MRPGVKEKSMMLVTGQGPQCTWALEGVRAGHLFQGVPLTWSLDIPEGHHSGSPKAASVLTVSHIEDTGVFNNTVKKKEKRSPPPHHTREVGKAWLIGRK